MPHAAYDKNISTIFSVLYLCTFISHELIVAKSPLIVFKMRIINKSNRYKANASILKNSTANILKLNNWT